MNSPSSVWVKKPIETRLRISSSCNTASTWAEGKGSLKLRASAVCGPSEPSMSSSLSRRQSIGSERDRFLQLEGFPPTKDTPIS